MTTYASLFAGGGLADVGALQAGCECLWAVEYDAQIASWHCRNIPGEVIVARVQDVDPARLSVPDILWASPVCKRASVANSGAEEAEEDMTAAEAVCRFLRVMEPRGFILENVQGYRTFRAMGLIRDCLTELGYWWDEQVLNAANFGVPQTRKRFIVRAVLGAFLPPYPSPTRWIGWYEAIADIINTLPESRFADWQLQRLPTEMTTCFVSDQSASAGEGVQVRPPTEPATTIRALSGGGNNPRAFLVGGANTSETQAAAGVGVSSEDEPTRCLAGNSSSWRAFLCHGTSTMELRDDTDPSAAVMATVHAKAAMPKAFLIDGKPANFAGDLSLKEQAEPVPTLTATQGQHPFRAFLTDSCINTIRQATVLDEEQPAFTIKAEAMRRPITEPKAWLSQGRVVSMTPRALARFQSLPDWYELPDNKKLACTIIGNGVSCLMAEAIIRTVQEAIL